MSDRDANSPALVLASSSPRRRQILGALGLAFDSSPANIDERRLPGEPAEAMVVRLAAEKAAAVAVSDEVVVLGADTAVVVADTILGKPLGKDEAVSMLLSLSGRTHRVMTGVAARRGRVEVTALSITAVQFRDIGRDEAERYWHSGEPRDKAGGYGIQGIGGIFVSQIRGSYSGVVGLPVFETAALLRQVGIHVIGKSGEQE